MPIIKFGGIGKGNRYARNTSGRHGFKKGQPVSQAVINGRWKGAVKPGEVLNPYGKLGRHRGKYRIGLRVGSRDGCLVKRRIKIEEKRAAALEFRELQELARTNASRAMRALIDIMKNPRAPESSRIAAAAIVLDRGYGKASQTNINANVNTDGKANEIAGDELERRIASALNRVEKLTGGAPKKTKSQKRPPDIRKYH